MGTKEKKAIGGRFQALLQSVDEVSEPVNITDVQQISLDDIALNPKQPRQKFNEEKLNELAQSIRIKGVLQPILVRTIESGLTHFELVAGERRLRASRLAGFDKVPALIKKIRDEDLLEVALIENIQRDNLNPIEEAVAYRNLINEHGYTQEDLAKRVGKNRSTISNMLRLLLLPEEIKKDIATEKFSAGHARALLPLDNPTEQIRLKEKVLSEHMSVRDIEKWVKEYNLKSQIEPEKKSFKENSSAQIEINEERLSQFFSTKVIIKSKGQKGKIELEYYSDEDFNRIFSLILNSHP